MFIKKSLLGMFIALISSVVLAGSVEMYSPVDISSAVQKASSSRFYIEGSAGWNQNHYKDRISEISSYSIILKTTRGNSTGNFGLDIGKKWNHYFSTEVGGFWNLPQKYYIRAIRPRREDYRIKIKSWQLYVSANICIPVYEKFRAIGKVGLGYQRAKIFRSETIYIPGYTRTESYVSPVFGVAMHYDWTPNAYSICEYMRFTGKSHMPDRIIKHANMFLFGFGYMFSI